MRQLLGKIQTTYRSLFGYIIKRQLLIAVCLAATVVVGGVFLGYENNKIVPLSQGVITHYTAEPNNRLSFMSNWDGPDYLNIVDKGYSSASQTNFFPLYPLAVDLVKTIVHSALDSALIVSWVCLIGAIYFYLKIVKLLFKKTDNIEALRAVLFFVLFPTGVFLIATYTESLFAVLALGAIYHSLRKKYILAGIFTYLACLTHVNGVFIVLLVFMLLLEQKVSLRKSLAAAIIGGLGLLSYMYYLLLKFNNPMAFLDAQKSHGWLHHAISGFLSSMGWMNVIFIILIIISVVYWWSRRKSFSIYSLVFLAIPLLGGQFGGFNRYVLMDFPLQLMLFDHFRNRRLAYSFCLTLSAVLWAYFLFQYAGGYVGG